MKAGWRIWLAAVVSWAPVIVVAIVLTNQIRGGAGFQWYDIAFYGVTGFISLAMALLLTTALIYKIRENSEKGKEARKAEYEAWLREHKKYHEEQEKKFSEVMASLGFQNPLADFLRLTKENKVRWEKVSADHLGVSFRAKNIVDGIGMELETGMEIETIPGPVLTYHELSFFDAQHRFENQSFVSISGGKDIEKEPEEKLVEEYSEWLMEKSKSK